jgi:hypothetical protein
MNFFRYSGVKDDHRDRSTQDASGHRSAPLGNINAPEELKVSPSPVCSLQLVSRVINFDSVLLLSPPVGAMISNSPSLVNSSDRPGLSSHKISNCSGVTRSKRSIALSDTDVWVSGLLSSNCIIKTPIYIYLSVRSGSL